MSTGNITLHVLICFSEDTSNIPRSLKAAGYRTGIIGKLHINPESATIKNEMAKAQPKTDPAALGTKNRATEQAVKLDELYRELETWRKDVGAEMMKPNPDYDPTVKPRKKRKRNEVE